MTIKNQRNLPGFTIVEMLIVVVIIGILASITLIAYNGVQQNARDKSIQSDLDALDALEAQYSTNNGGNAKTWYSGTGTVTPDVDLAFTPSKGNVIDAEAGAGEYCIRGYNVQSNKNSLSNSFIKESTKDACDILPANGSTDALAGWYKLNGNANDSSLGAHNGTVSGATLVPSENNDPNGAYTFSSTAIQSINTNYNFPLEKFTISMWVKPSGSAQNTYATLISNTRDCCAAYNGFQISYSFGTNFPIATRLWAGGTSPANSLTYAGMTIGVWQHIAMSYDGTTVRLYVNGLQKATGTYTGTIGSSAYNVFIGKGGWTNGYSFGGDIDDVRIYNYALSAARIQAINDYGAV